MHPQNPEVTFIYLNTVLLQVRQAADDEQVSQVYSHGGQGIPTYM